MGFTIDDHESDSPACQSGKCDCYDRFMDTADHPLVRASTFCPLCLGYKNTGQVACWECYHRHGVRYGDPEAEHTIDEAERALEAAS